MKILPIAVFALLLTNICYADEKPIPTSKEELAEWIIGTEWGDL